MCKGLTDRKLQVATLPIPSNLADIAQGVQSAATTNIAQSATAAPFLGQVTQLLALLQVLGVLNPEGLLASLGSLTNLAQIQIAAQSISPLDLVITVNYIVGKTLVLGSQIGAMLSNPIVFI